jgi:lipopolysaccharide transport system permease protein
MVRGIPASMKADTRPDTAAMTSLFSGHLDAVRDALRLFYRHRRLTWEMAKSELSERYSGQVLGAFWSVVHPLLQIGLYLFIFAYVFRATLGDALSFPRDYATYILAGLVPWIGLQDSLNRATTAIHANASLVKQVVFPIEILPMKGVVVTTLSQLISLSLLALYLLARYQSLPWTYFLLPVLVATQIAVMTGFSLALSAAGAYFRDLKDIVQVLALGGMYISPVFYLPEKVPSLFEPLIYANPFSYMIWCYQDVIYFGAIRHPAAWLVFFALGFLGLSVGFRAFRRAKLFIGNVV